MINNTSIPLPSSSLGEKGRLRQFLLSQRRALSVAERHAAALAAAQRLAMEPDFIEAMVVAGYWACQGELNPAPLLEHSWAKGKAVYLPVLAGDALLFAPYQPDVPLRRNRFDIPEPEVSPADLRLPSDMDWVLMPLVAFDAFGTRLGMGGGFYDRSFAFLLNPGWQGHHPRLLGLGYAFQRVEALVRQPWDVPLNAAVTEETLYLFAKNPVEAQ